MTTTQPEGTSQPPEPGSPAGGGPGGDLPLAISHAAMNAAYDNGEAVPLGTAVAWLARYRDSWWVVYERGWLRVTDAAASEDIDKAAARLTQAEAITDRGAGMSGASGEMLDLGGGNADDFDLDVI